MITIPITINAGRPCEHIPLGKRGENDATQIVFDVSWLIETFGEGTAQLVALRPDDDDPYPAVTMQDDEARTVTWTLTNADTANAGRGECELFWYVGGALAKTVVYRTEVLRDIGDASEEAPEPYETWVEQVLAAGQSAEEAVEHYPHIEDGTWRVWQNDAWTDTGVNATGPQGEKGDDGEDAVVYVLEPSFNAIVYDPNAEEGSRLNPSELTVTSYQITHGVRGEYGAYKIGMYFYAGDTVVGASSRQADPMMHNPIFDLTATLPEAMGGSGHIVAYMESKSGKLVQTEIPVIEAGVDASISDAVFRATYGVTTSAEIEAAYQAGKVVLAEYGALIYRLTRRNAGTRHYFAAGTTMDGQPAYYLSCEANTWAFHQYTPAVVTSVNGQTGDVDVDEVFWATYGTTTSAELHAAFAAGRPVCVKHTGGYSGSDPSVQVYHLDWEDSPTLHYFHTDDIDWSKRLTIVCSNNAWSARTVDRAATYDPEPLGTATPGTVSRYAREDHVHPMPSAADVGALPASTVIPTKTSDLTNDSGFVNASGAASAAPVQSVNGKTGAAVLSASDVGAGTYSKPSGGIPKNDLASAVQTSLDNADAALPATGNAYRTASIPMGALDGTSTATVMTATVSGITELRDGVCVWLENGVVTSASGFTININGLGAKPVYSSLAAATRVTTAFNVNYTMLLVYNSTRVSGGCWDMVYGYDTNTTYTPPKLGFGYGTCTTAAATAAKTASISSYTLVAGGIVAVKFDNDVPANATLNITSKGAKAIYYRGAAITAGVINAGDTVTMIYSTYYHVLTIDRGGAPVASVNGQTGAVVLDADDVGAIAAPSSPASGAFLVWNGSAWVAQTLSTWQGGSY